MPDLALFLCAGRALANADRVFNLSSNIQLSIAFLAFFLIMAKVAIQHSTRSWIGIYMLVNQF